jgi:hypothetical protein
MANVIDKNENENEQDNDDTLVDSWETENGLVFELHCIPDGSKTHDELIVIEPEDENEPAPKRDDNDQIVGLALNLEDLDEAMGILNEIREKMVERQSQQAPPKPRLVKAAAKK